MQRLRPSLSLLVPLGQQAAAGAVALGASLPRLSQFWPAMLACCQAPRLDVQNLACSGCWVLRLLLP